MIMKYTFNIGLNNNNYSTAVMHINNAKGGGYFDNYHIREMQGTYNGIAEPTIVLTVETKADIVSMVGLTEKWCKAMNQTCIAIELQDKENNTFGALIYNPTFKGEQSTFDKKYFINN